MVISRKCPNTSMTIIDVDKNGKGVAVQWGDVSHLTGKVIKVNADEAMSATARTSTPVT
jgi:hypothetical protein